MFTPVKTFLSRVVFLFLQKRFKLRLAYFERNRIDTDNWKPNVDLLLSLIKIIDTRVLTTDQRVIAEYSFTSGFKNVTHLSNWITLMADTINNRSHLDFELTKLSYYRNICPLNKFLTRDDNTMIDLTTFLGVLEIRLEALKLLMYSIEDDIYRDKIVYTFNQITPDIFAILECICALGARDE